jgi:hypothetical protein
MRSHLLLSFGTMALLLGAAPRTVVAQGSPSVGGGHAGVGIALRFGTLGVGLEASKLLTGHFAARVGANYFKFSTTKSQSDIDYKATAKLKAVSALIDFFLKSRGSFHLTGGLMTNPAKVSGTGQPTQTGEFEINGNSYTTAEVGTLKAEGKFPGVSPYLGIGWGTPARDDGALRFLFDLGATIGKAKISLTATGAAANPALASDLQAQEKKTQKDVDKYAKLYPVVLFGLAYRF